MAKVYVAGPLGFNEPGRHWATTVLHPGLTAAGWEILDPWVDESGEIAATLALPPGPARIDALRAMSRSIGVRNRLRTDFRLADHEAAIVNLQVEDFVVASGGSLVTTLDDALRALGSLLA